MEPLAIATLKALTPSAYQTVFYDDRIELIDYQTDAGLIAITVEVYTALRAYNIADRFRALGKKVVLGGYHVTLNPEEAALHADALVIGNAEPVWETVLADYSAGALRARYSGSCEYRDILPDRSIFRGKGYSAMGVIETGRGCVFSCEFCAITAFYKATYHRKPVDQVVREIVDARKHGKKVFFFADDNIVADQEHAIALFKAIAPLKIRWSAQGSLTMAANPELLRWIRKSGCTVMLIGYESLDNDNLRQMNKDWNRKIGNVIDLTAAIHRSGINIYATFLFGYDHDTPSLFAETGKFAERCGFYFAAFNHLLPMPGTPLHNRLQAEGKLIEENWWLRSGYLYGQLVFHPAALSASQVSRLCRDTRKAFYRPLSILRRGLRAFLRNPDPLLSLYFWYLNFKLGQEVDEKMHLPIGQNLDELPK